MRLTKKYQQNFHSTKQNKGATLYCNLRLVHVVAHRPISDGPTKPCLPKITMRQCLWKVYRQQHQRNGLLLVRPVCSDVEAGIPPLGCAGYPWYPGTGCAAAKPIAFIGTLGAVSFGALNILLLAPRFVAAVPGRRTHSHWNWFNTEN